MRRRKSKQGTNASELAAESRVSRSDIVKIIADRIRSPDQTIRQARNTVSHCISYTVRKGNLTMAEAGFKFGDAVRWMRAEWPGKFDDLPVSKGVVGQKIPQNLAVRATIEAEVIPGTLDRCNAALHEARHQIQDLEAELHNLRMELERLRPLAEKWKALCARNRKNSKLPRSQC